MHTGSEKSISGGKEARQQFSRAVHCTRLTAVLPVVTGSPNTWPVTPHLTPLLCFALHSQALQHEADVLAVTLPAQQQHSQYCES